MNYDFNRIKDELVVAEITHSLTGIIERKLEELHEKNTSPYINGIKGLANYLGVGTTLAQEIKNDKKIPSYQNGRTVWFKKSEADKYINSLKS